MTIWSAPYTLVARHALSGKAVNKIRIGALLKVEDSGGVGYADLHPWPEFNDEPLEEQIKILAEGKTTELSRRSLALADLDRKARQKGVSAFEGLDIPDSHFPVSDIYGLREASIEGIWSEGFRTIKFKFGRDVEGDAKRIRDLEPALRRFNIRGDFNGLLLADEISRFFGLVPESILERIEFLEDPMPWNDSLWKALKEFKNLPFAIDRMTDDEAFGLEARGLPTNAFQWMMIKPAIQDPMRIAKLAKVCGSKIAVTTYLDHPVGQMGAALEAAQLKKGEFGDMMGLAGLCSHRVFEKNEFIEAIEAQGPQLMPADGKGIGFDALLEKQTWKKVR